MKKVIFIVLILLTIGMGNLFAQTDKYDKVIIGIFANPVGFITFGPMAGIEITYKNFNAEATVRFPSLGLLMPIIHDPEYENTITSGFGAGIGFKFYLPGRIGGFYAGGFFEYSGYKYKYNNYKEDGETTSLSFGTSVGYRFVFSSGLYIRAGGYFGVSSSETINRDHNINKETTSKDILFFGLLDAAIGFSF